MANEGHYQGSYAGGAEQKMDRLLREFPQK